MSIWVENMRVDCPCLCVDKGNILVMPSSVAIVECFIRNSVVKCFIRIRLLYLGSAILISLILFLVFLLSKDTKLKIWGTV